MHKAINCIINRHRETVTLPPGAVAMDLVRRHLKLPGTKEGCREGECGACTVLIGELIQDQIRYKSVASCLLPIGELEGKHLVTVEGLNGDSLTTVQQALVDEGATQCGFCTPGFVLSLTGFLLGPGPLDYENAMDALDGNICRCTGYLPIQRAAKTLCGTLAEALKKEENKIPFLVKEGVLPDYFLEIPEQLKAILADSPADKSPLSVEAILAARGGKKGKTTIVAGGTDLYVQKPGELAEEEPLFISRCADWKGIEAVPGAIKIGAAATVEEMKQSPLLERHLPGLKTHLNRVASTIMRNRATPGGNIVNASPIGDLTIMLLALDATVCLAKGKKKREVPLDAFFKDYKKMDLKAGEIIEAVTFPIPPVNSRFHFEKVSQREYLDIASCNTALLVQTEGDRIARIRISAGGVGPIPLYLAKTSAFLEGKAVSAPVLSEATAIMAGEISPISDVRGTARYKSLLLRNLIYAHFVVLFPDSPLARECPPLLGSDSQS